jgi:hypothetical protein
MEEMKASVRHAIDRGQSGLEAYYQDFMNSSLALMLAQVN